MKKPIFLEINKEVVKLINKLANTKKVYFEN